ncbi:MAG: hypothetical protein GQ544_03525 [Candidatus Aminicenantes bacterium]|nr:hypothetical protein [Candidatus Aminicenantes bacterium]
MKEPYRKMIAFAWKSESRGDWSGVLLEKTTGKRPIINRETTQKGDVPHTFASIEKAQLDLGYSPNVPLEEGLKEEWRWIKALYA